MVKYTVLPVLVCGCETWSLIPRNERWLKVSEDRVLRKIFGPKRKEVTGEWRKLYEVPNDMHSSTNIVRVIKSRMRWAGHVSRTRESKGSYRVLVGKPEGKRQLGRPRRNGKIIFRWILRKWGCGHGLHLSGSG